MRRDFVFSLLTRVMIFFILICSVFTPLSQVTSHNPENLELTYSFALQLLHVSIEHDVEEVNWGSHYIDSVLVWKNNVFETSQYLDNQSSQSSYQLSFPITAEHNDVLKATVTCSLGGEISTSITVYDPASPSPTPTNLVSFPFKITLSALVMLSVFWHFVRMNYKRKISS